MTNKQAIETIKTAIAEVEWNYPMEYAIAFEKAVKSLEKDRKRARYYKHKYHQLKFHAKVGKWIDTGTQDSMIGNVFKCSNCGEETILDCGDNFCPKCGCENER